MRGPLRPVLLMVLGVAVIVALTIVALVTTPAGGATPSPAVAPTVSVPVAFVGDSFTSGTDEGGRGAANYTALLAQRNGWSVTTVAVDGSGYVAGRAFAAQLPAVVAARPRTVVVIGGRADYQKDPADVRDAAELLFENLAREVPQARVVVVGPIWPAVDAPLRARSVRDAVRDAAAAAKLPFVDPIAEQWFNGQDVSGVAADGEHLNDSGHREMADLVGDAVRRSEG